MSPFRHVSWLRTWIACLVLAPVPVRAAAFAHETSDLPADPSIRWGRLDNGLRFALLPNPPPREQVSMRLAVQVGSLHESDLQRGLAHFLGHLAFSGGQRLPADKVAGLFRRLGMDFGGDTNVTTGFDRTLYRLELPDARRQTLRESLAFLADVAGGLRFQPDEIDREREIILGERRARDPVGLRTFQAELEFLVPDTRFPQRLPIGLEDVIRHATREHLGEFYDAWYRPERMFLVIAGDFEPTVVEPIVREIFSPLAATAPARPEPRLGVVTAPGNIETGLHSEPGAGGVRVTLQTVAPHAPEPDTADWRRGRLPRTLALHMLNRRLAILARQEGAPFVGGLVGVTEQFGFFRNASIELDCRPDQWTAALGVAEQELRRALEHGFQPEELAEAVAGMRNHLEEAVRTAAARHSAELADRLAEQLLDRSVPTHPAADLVLYAPALARIRPEDCTSALREAWPVATGRKIFVTGNLTLPQASLNIAAAYAASRRVPVDPPARPKAAGFAYTDFGRTGKVAQTETVADLGVTLVRFRNDVRLNLKVTDFEAGRIRVSVRVGGGLLTHPPGQAGLGLLANVAFTTGGLGKHSVDELRRLLAGRTIGLGFGAQEDAFTFSGTTTRDDLLLQLQLFCAYLTDPGYRPESLRQVQQGAGQLYARLENTPEGRRQLEADSLLAGGDPRFGLPPREVMLSRTLDELRAWLTPELANGAIEIAMVGDLDRDAAIAAVAQTFGALPRRRGKPGYAEARRVIPPAVPLAREYLVPTEIPRGLVRLCWPATDNRDPGLACRLQLLAAVLSDRLRVRIREEMGGSSIPVVSADLSGTYPGYGWLIADATVAPADARLIADTIKAVAGWLRADGVSDEELARARQFALAALRESSRSNSYWLDTVLASAQEFPERLGRSRRRQADTEEATAAELSELARQYLDPERVSEFIVLPVRDRDGGPAPQSADGATRPVAP